MRLVSRSLLALCALSTFACVPQSRYDLAVKNAADREREGDEARAEVLALRKRNAELQRDGEERAAKIATYEEQIAQDSRKLAELEKKMEALSSANTEVGERLRLAGMTLTELANERQRLTLAVSDTRACLEALHSARTRVQTTQAAKPAAGVTTTTAATAESPELELERCVQRAVTPPTPAPSN